METKRVAPGAGSTGAFEDVKSGRGEIDSQGPAPEQARLKWEAADDIAVTFFEDEYARKQRAEVLTLGALHDLILTTTARTKKSLPWLKLATFGRVKSDNNCLRHDANVLSISGVELDYDAGIVSFDDALQKFTAAGLAALIYTSASHTLAAPRWRVLLPASRNDLPPEARRTMAARANGVLGGICAPESFVLSQSYLFGSVASNPEHRAEIVEGDFIDLRADLDAGALTTRKPKTSTVPDELVVFDTPRTGYMDAEVEAVLAKLAVLGERSTNFAYATKLAVEKGMTFADFEALCREHPQGCAQKYLPPQRHDELRKRIAEIWEPHAAQWAEAGRFIAALVAQHDAAKRATHTAKASAARSTASGVAEPGLGVWDAGHDIELPPPREWILGNTFCRKFISSLLGDGGVGKTALRILQALSVATGRDFTDEHVFLRCRVLILCLEDNADELRRRVFAARLHYNISAADIEGWLFLSAPGGEAGKLLSADNGRLVPGKLAARIEAEIVAHKIDLLIIDPFVKTHSVEENTNTAIDNVVQIIADLSAKHNIAIDTPHHTSKGTPEPGNADRGRGASAMKDGARLVDTMTPMSDAEAATFNIDPIIRKSFVRLDSAKVNIAPPMFEAKWFRLIGVSLGNGTELYPSGDNVQTVERWYPPQIWADLTDNLKDEIVTAIDIGLPDGSRYTDAPRADDRAAWKVVEKYVPDKSEAAAREIIKSWVKTGVLDRYEYTNPATRKLAKGLKKGPKAGSGRLL